MSSTKLKHRRLQLLSEDSFPTQSEIRCQLGGPLAEVFFDSLDDTCKEDLGLIPPLKGVVSSDLWMSPSDVLVGRVLMKMPMPTRRVVRALTHEGILEIGDNCLHKLSNEYSMDKQQCLIELRMNMEATAKEERDKAVEIATAELKELHNKEIEKLLEQCKEDVTTATAQTEIREARLTAVRIQEEREEVHELMQDKLEEGVKSVADQLTQEFIWRMNETVRELGSYYGQYIGDQIAHFNWRLQLAMIEQENYELQLRYRLEAQNSSDVAYAVCRERQRCHGEKETVRQEYQAQTVLLQETIDEQIAQLQRADAANSAKDAKFNTWVEKVRELVKEFQKFINYALKAVPGQAQFLLSVEKLLKREIEKPTVEVDIIETMTVESKSMTGEPSDATSVATSVASHTSEKVSIASTSAMSTTKSKASEAESGTVSIMTATQPVAHVLDTLVVQATPLNTDQEEIIGEILEKLVNKSCPDPEAEEIAVGIVDELVCETVPLDVLKIDASTQSPELPESPDAMEAASQMSSQSKLSAPKYMVKEASTVDLTALPTDGPIAGEQECAWCEIKAKLSTSVCVHEPTMTDSILLMPQEESIAPESAEVAPESAEVAPESAEVVPEQLTFQERGYVGEGGNEHEQPDDEFLQDRVEALLKIFHNHPSLTQIFIS